MTAGGPKNSGQTTIGIIGFGRFGRLMARYLADDFRVCVYDSGTNRDGIRALGAAAVSLETACRRSFVILAVPISALRSTLESIRPHLKDGTTVVDVCSVKTYPVRWMREHLPETVSILATHPMFGPDSAAVSLKGRKIVLCPERIETTVYEKVRQYLAAKGLTVIETTAERHDREISISLAMTHFIGRTLSEFGAAPLEIDTEGYQRLLHVLGVVQNDTWQLFVDMNTYNPYAREQRRRLLAAAERISKRIADEPPL